VAKNLKQSVYTAIYRVGGKLFEYVGSSTIAMKIVVQASSLGGSDVYPTKTCSLLIA
jgi:hypothetical protein